MGWESNFYYVKDGDELVFVVCDNVFVFYINLMLLLFDLDDNLIKYIIEKLDCLVVDYKWLGDGDFVI